MQQATAEVSSQCQLAHIRCLTVRDDQSHPFLASLRTTTNDFFRSAVTWGLSQASRCVWLARSISCAGCWTVGLVQFLDHGPDFRIGEQQDEIRMVPSSHKTRNRTRTRPWNSTSPATWSGLNPRRVEMFQSTPLCAYRGRCEKSRGSRLRFFDAVLAPIPPDKEGSSGREKRSGEEQSRPSVGFALTPAKSQLVQSQIQRGPGSVASGAP